MDGIGEAIGGLLDVGAGVAFMPSGGSNNNASNSGCAIFIIIFAVLGLAGFGLSQCQPKQPEPPPVPKESLSYRAGQKAKRFCQRFY